MVAVSGMMTRSTARQRSTEMNSQSTGPLAETLTSAKGAVAHSGMSCTQRVRSLARWQRRPVPMIRGTRTPPLCRLGTSGQRQAQEELHPQEEPQPFQPQEFHPFQPLLQPQPQEEPQPF